MSEQTPIFKFAVTTTVRESCPARLEDKTLEASDFVPARSRVKDTGYDVRCAEPKGLAIEPFCYFKMKLGFRMFAPDGWWMELKPRSGTFINDHIHSLYGTIDETYENEMVFAGIWIPDSCKILAANTKTVIPFGKRIAQLVPVLRVNMLIEEIENEQYDAACKIRNDPRGTGGFGSSGGA